MNMAINELEQIAVDSRMLATNFTDVVPSCCGADMNAKTFLQNRHPLYDWLINTQLSARVRDEMSGRNANCFLYSTHSSYYLKVPGTFWSLAPEGSAEECCWAPFDFAKCEGEVPVKRLCLKDCDSIDNELLGRFLRVNGSYDGIAEDGETYWETKKRIARLSMAFLTVYNVMYGRMGQTTNILKEFHGLFDVMSNPAVVSVSGTNVLSAFASIACRFRTLGVDFNNTVIAVNPIVYASINAAVQPDQYNRLPSGWTRNGNELRFEGMRFIEDRFVPVDMEEATGEAWILSSDAVGLWLATDILPADSFIKESGHQEQTLANGCGSSCTYYYNFGAVFNNNANRIGKVVNIPISGACIASTGDLGAIINPTTLIPNL